MNVNFTVFFYFVLNHMVVKWKEEYKYMLEALRHVQSWLLHFTCKCNCIANNFLQSSWKLIAAFILFIVVVFLKSVFYRHSKKIVSNVSFILWIIINLATTCSRISIEVYEARLFHKFLTLYIKRGKSCFNECLICICFFELFTRVDLFFQILNRIHYSSVTSNETSYFKYKFWVFGRIIVFNPEYLLGVIQTVNGRCLRSKCCYLDLFQWNMC